jgi:hypothetical protein
MVDLFRSAIRANGSLTIREAWAEVNIPEVHVRLL